MRVEEVVRRSEVPKSSVLRILKTLRTQGLVVRDPTTRTYQAAVQLIPNPALMQPYLMPGDVDWQRTEAAWYRVFMKFSIPYITTYSWGGDADMGVMWRWIPNDAGFTHLRFTVHGGHGQVLLIAGPEPIPTMGDVVAIHREILAGSYGDVLETVQGPDDNHREIPITWDLTKGEQEGGVKVVIIDSLNEPWGFISVSRMALHRL